MKEGNKLLQSQANVLHNNYKVFKTPCRSSSCGHEPADPWPLYKPSNVTNVRGMRHKHSYTIGLPRQRRRPAFLHIHNKQQQIELCHWCTANPSGTLFFFSELSLLLWCKLFSAIWWALMSLLFLTSPCALRYKVTTFTTVTTAPNAGAFYAQAKERI